MGIAEALFSKVQQQVLGILFGNPDRSFFANELIALADSGTGAVQRELGKLERSGLVSVTHIGRQKHYQANPASPVFEEIKGLILKTVGLVDAVRHGLMPVRERINVAFVFGSVAKGQDTSSSDIDLLIISDSLHYADIFGALEPISLRLGRKVNPTLYSSEEFKERVKRDNAFVKRVLEQRKLWVIGEESGIAES